MCTINLNEQHFLEHRWLVERPFLWFAFTENCLSRIFTLHKCKRFTFIQNSSCPARASFVTRYGIIEENPPEQSPLQKSEVDEEVSWKEGGKYFMKSCFNVPRKCFNPIFRILKHFFSDRNCNNLKILKTYTFFYCCWKVIQIVELKIFAFW